MSCHRDQGEFLEPFGNCPDCGKPNQTHLCGTCRQPVHTHKHRTPEEWEEFKAGVVAIFRRRADDGTLQKWIDSIEPN